MKLGYMLIVLAFLSIVYLFIGNSAISPMDIFHLTPVQLQVLQVSRFPRLVSILVAGISMSVIGLIMQQLTRNRFVSPTTAGTMDSARLGILVTLMWFPGASPLQKMLVAFAFALAGTLIFMRILEKVKFKDTIYIALLGLMFGNIVSSVTTFFAYKNDLIQNMSSWLQGDFSTIMKGRYELIYISIPLLIIVYLFANRFTLAGMGEDFSTNLGLAYRKVVNLGLILVAMVSAVVIITVGTIPFLGLVVPNIVTLYKGDNLRDTLPHTAVLGAIFVLVCDILGQLIIYPYQLSISLTVGVVGSVLFLYLLLRRKAYES
ncbi:MULTISPECIES: ABC transporter permease [Paenibacillus]|uniref:ABC transporter permease n=1 Tax=Paenibacillus TaxID=44249 RepID=UPI0007BF6E99|nr:MULTISPECIES: ABC transporter permease [Paenibacillus]MCZ1264234.1 ABC transporter permease [Paenibacillus tundrae]OAX46182.1 Iron-uptake system permease protein FeuB [Paenibacillus sp. AD87]SDK91270.1 iron complex transport system permease protein [Paenibacillus sp. OK060]SEB18560.1 iron complex transport system permease protein [Paenibacillus sp. 276b]SEK50335.1 iron complex transport system permease protein [Paenibacillus sp. OK003]